MVDVNLIQGDCLDIMRGMEAESIDLTVTSPPYDNLRNYNGYVFDFENIAKELYRVTKPGGVVVWVVGDATINGSETGTSFKHALFFKEIGFNLHDTMIYYRQSPYPSNVRYNQVFEYMFVLSKGGPKTFNGIIKQEKSENSFSNDIKSKTYRNKDGETNKLDNAGISRISLARGNKLKLSDNIWYIKTGYMISSPDKESYKHPATFPEQIASGHILSWSNPGDVVMDPFMGSGTTGKMAVLYDRNFIGIEISEEYMSIAQERIRVVQMQPNLFEAT